METAGGRSTREGNCCTINENAVGDSKITTAKELTRRGIQALELTDIICDLEQSYAIED